MKERHRRKILRLYTDYHRVYGPYTRKDGYKIVNLYGDNKKTTKQYARVKMEVKLGRILRTDETVQHINGNRQNNLYSNLEVLSKVEHSKCDAKRRIPHEAKCAWCKKEFLLRVDQVKKRMQSKAGPFCSRRCTGLYGASIQNGSTVLKRKKIKVEYYNLRDSRQA